MKKPARKDDLRAAILETAVAIVAEEGLDALSMRDVARRLGVTHQAPYHHFHDRGAILAAIRDEGFTRLGVALAAARTGTGSVRARFRRQGEAYVDFALAHRAHFKVMFRPELMQATMSAPPDTAFTELLAMVAEAQAGGLFPRGDVQPWALLCWSVVHGASSLAVDGPLASTPEVAKGTVASFVRALGGGAVTGSKGPRASPRA